MILRLFLFITSLSATLKETLWRFWYQALASYNKREWRFMNYGYVSNDALPLSKEDEKNRLFIQLYDHVLKGIDMKEKAVLEIGSGRGGGADFVARTFLPASLIGLDFSKKAVSLCNQFYKLPNLSFVVGDAEKLPFASNSFDLVYNIESSHCYGNMYAFVSEVFRVLKPGGIFAWADLRTLQDLEKDDAIFRKSPFAILFKEEITDNVLQALDQISLLKEEAIKENVPSYLQKVFSEFAGTRDSQIFQGFKKGKIVYMCYRFQKP